MASSSKDFFTIQFLIILVRHRETKKDRPFPPPPLSPLPSPPSAPHIFRPVGFSSKRRSGKTNRWHRLSRHALRNFRDFLVLLPPPPPPHNKGVLARATDRANFKYRVFLKHSGKRLGRWWDMGGREGKKGWRGERRKAGRNFVQGFLVLFSSYESFCRDYGTGTGMGSRKGFVKIDDFWRFEGRRAFWSIVARDWENKQSFRKRGIVLSLIDFDLDVKSRNFRKFC